MKMPMKDLMQNGKHEVFQIFVCDYKELGEKYKKWDTAFTNEKGELEYYPLPKGKLIVISILTSSAELKEAFNWNTIRRWTPQKEKYYRSLIDQEVKIEI